MGRILIVEDDPEIVEMLTRFLEGTGHTFQSAHDAETAMHRIRAWNPGLVLLDLGLPGSSGLDLISKIRAASVDEYIAIIILSGNIDPVPSTDPAIQADDFISKPFRVQDLISRVQVALKLKETHDALRRSHHRVEELTTSDGVTGLLNLQAFYRKGEEELLRARHFRKPVSLLALNLDGFSSVNEKGGFPFGNYVLREAAQRIQSCLRVSDVAGRMGSDEFLVLLPDTQLSAAQEMAERIRDAIKAQSFKQERHSVQVTTSIGIAGASYEQGEPKMDDLLRYTVEALRTAKAGGKDQLEVYSFA